MQPEGAPPYGLCSLHPSTSINTHLRAAFYPAGVRFDRPCMLSLVQSPCLSPHLSPFFVHREPLTDLPRRVALLKFFFSLVPSIFKYRLVPCNPSALFIEMMRFFYRPLDRVGSLGMSLRPSRIPHLFLFVSSCIFLLHFFLTSDLRPTSDPASVSFLRCSCRFSVFPSLKLFYLNGSLPPPYYISKLHARRAD